MGERIETMSVVALQAESARLESSISGLERQIADLRAEFGQVRNELAKRLRPTPEPRLSDHALMRFIERVFGVDFEAMRAEILNPNIVAAIKAGASAVTVRGVKMLVKDNTIVTVVTDEQKNAGKAKRLRPYREIDDEEDAA